MLRVGHRGDHFGAKPDGLSLAQLEANPHGIDFGPLEPRLEQVLSTESGKIDLAPAAIVADLPRLLEEMKSKNGSKPLLIGRRQLRSANSWTHNVEVLMKGKERCTLEIHPDDASRFGLVEWRDGFRDERRWQGRTAGRDHRQASAPELYPSRMAGDTASQVPR